MKKPSLKRLSAVIFQYLKYTYSLDGIITLFFYSDISLIISYYIFFFRKNIFLSVYIYDFIDFTKVINFSGLNDYFIV